ncbi:hypothetical protein EV361DRAFT_872405 [Lentinula raphanica]|nr:hypothetical protein EV361DRAFT_872405 [Lentinula raphanica]
MADDVEDSTPVKAKTKTKKHDTIDNNDTPKFSKTNISKTDLVPRLPRDTPQNLSSFGRYLWATWAKGTFPDVKSKRKHSERNVDPADSDKTEWALSPQAHSTVHAVTTISQPCTVGEDLIKRVKYSLELADTNLMQHLHNIGLAHNPELESYTKEQYNAFINFHMTQLFDCIMKAHFYAHRGEASQRIIDNARAAWKAGDPLPKDEDTTMTPADVEEVYVFSAPPLLPPVIKIAQTDLDDPEMQGPRSAP